MIDDLAIRLATKADAAEIAAMSRDTIEHGLPWRWREARVERAITSAHTNVAVLGQPAMLIAFGIMEYLDDDAHLVLFAVRPAHQRQGIGSAVLAWLEAAARAAGASRIRLEARRDNAAARSFYNEHGFHELLIKRGMYSDATDGIQMEKWLRDRAA